MKSSVILCTRNRLDDVLKFTASLVAQTEPPTEYIIIDSSDKPLEKEERYLEAMLKVPFPLVYKHTSPGLTYQRNQGIECATGDVFHFFDDDTTLYPDYLEIMNRTLREHPEYAGGMGTFANMPNNFRSKVLTSFAKVFMLLRAYGDGRFYPSGFPKYPHGKVTKLQDTEIISGGLMCFRRNIFQEFQYDENLEGHSYLEDVDFSRRVSNKHRLFINPDAQLIHHHDYSNRAADNSRGRRKQYLYNHRYFFFKNFYKGNRYRLIAHWWSILGLFIHALFKPMAWIMGYMDGLKEFHRYRRSTK